MSRRHHRTSTKARDTRQLLAGLAFALTGAVAGLMAAVASHGL